MHSLHRWRYWGTEKGRALCHTARQGTLTEALLPGQVHPYSPLLNIPTSLGDGTSVQRAAAFSHKSPKALRLTTTAAQVL